MNKKILKNVRRLSKEMEETLMDIHEQELLFITPTTGYINRTTKALYRRGMVELKYYQLSDKPFYGFRITPFGIYYLTRM